MLSRVYVWMLCPIRGSDVCHYLLTNPWGTAQPYSQNHWYYSILFSLCITTRAYSKEMLLQEGPWKGSRINSSSPEGPL